MTTPFDLNLRHVRALSAIAESRSVSIAARVSNMSQPALTQGLAKLETQFGSALFERRPQGLEATPAGAQVLARTGRAMARFARAVRSGTRLGRADRPEQRLTSAQVRAILSLAETGSFVAAAQAVGLSEPALHRSVKELEALCALTLVERYRVDCVRLRTAACSSPGAVRSAGSSRSAAGCR